MGFFDFLGSLFGGSKIASENTAINQSASGNGTTVGGNYTNNTINKAYIGVEPKLEPEHLPKDATSLLDWIRSEGVDEFLSSRDYSGVKILPIMPPNVRAPDIENVQSAIKKLEAFGYIEMVEKKKSSSEKYALTKKAYETL